MIKEKCSPRRSLVQKRKNSKKEKKKEEKEGVVDIHYTTSYPEV